MTHSVEVFVSKLPQIKDLKKPSEQVRSQMSRLVCVRTKQPGTSEGGPHGRASILPPKATPPLALLTMVSVPPFMPVSANRQHLSWARGHVMSANRTWRLFGGLCCQPEETGTSKGTQGQTAGLESQSPHPALFAFEQVVGYPGPPFPIM